MEVGAGFEQIGGHESVRALVDRFYAEMDRNPAAQSIRAMHAASLGPIKHVLERYLGEWLGGPPVYSRERGHPRLRMRHFRFAIGPDERDAWLACMNRALAQSAPEPQLREQLGAAFAGLANHMINQPEV